MGHFFFQELAQKYICSLKNKGKFLSGLEYPTIWAIFFQELAQKYIFCSLKNKGKFLSEPFFFSRICPKKYFLFLKIQGGVKFFKVG